MDSSAFCFSSNSSFSACWLESNHEVVAEMASWTFFLSPSEIFEASCSSLRDDRTWKA